MMNETGLWRVIDERIGNAMGLTRAQVDVQSFVVDVLSYNQIVDLGQDTVVLVSPTLDIPYTAQLLLDAGNNLLETSKEDYEKLAYMGYQFFQDRLTIQTSNYGIDFVPFRLEFIRISPNINRP